MGYGDVYPMTAEGRVAAMVLMVLGIGLYSAIRAAVTSYFVNSRSSEPAPSLIDELERLAKLRTSPTMSDEEPEGSVGHISPSTDASLRQASGPAS